METGNESGYSSIQQGRQTCMHVISLHGRNTKKQRKPMPPSILGDTGYIFDG